MRCFWSATTRVLSGSAALAVAAAAFGGAWAAQPQGDRLSQPAAYRGPFLTWAGKTGGPDAAPAAQPMAETLGPAYAAQRTYAPPQTAAAEFASWPAPAPAAAPQSRPAAPSRYATQAQYAAPAQPAAPAQYAAPQRYATATPTYAPPPAPAEVAPAAPAPTAAAPYVAAPEPAARRRPPAQAAAPTPPAAAAAPAAQALAQNDAAAGPAVSPTLQPTGVHYYSLHREYGLTPDAIVTPKDRPMVLIGPPDDPPAQKQDSANDGGGSDRHGDGEGADQ